MCGFWAIKMAPWGSQAKQICPWVAKIYPLLMNVMPYTGGHNLANLKPKPRGLTMIYGGVLIALKENEGPIHAPASHLHRVMWYTGGYSFANLMPKPRGLATTQG